MKNNIAVVICIYIFSLNISAQKKKDLIGTWKTIRTDSNGIAVPPLTIEHFSFYKSGSCEVRQEPIRTDTTNNNSPTAYAYMRKWEIKHNKNLVLLNKFYNDSRSIQQEYIIRSLTDSLLVMSYSTEKTEYILHLVKASPILETQYSYHKPRKRDFRKYEKYYYLVNSADTTKKIRIKHYDGISLTIEEPLRDSTLKSITSWADGSIDQLNDSTLNLDVSSYNTKATYKNDSTITISKDYRYDSEYIKNINLHNVKSVTYSSSTREGVNAIAGGMIYISAQTLLLVAPLVSIKYKRGDGAFNAQRYFQWAAASLIGLGTSVTVALLSTQKTYSITTKGAKKDKEYWYFEN